MKKDFNKSIFRIFISYFGKHKGLFILDMICATFIAGVDIAFPLVSRHAMYDLLPNNEYRTFFLLMATVTLAFVLRSICYYVIAFLGHIFGVRVEADIREDLYLHFQEQDFEFYDKHRTGELMNRLTGDLFEITELSHHGPEDLLISTVTIIGALIAMFTIDWKLALGVLIIIPIFVLIVILCKKGMMEASIQVKKKMAGINSSIESSISGMRTSKAFDNADVDFERFDYSNDMFKHSKGDFYKAMGKFNASMEFTICFLQVAIIALGGYLIMQDSLNYIDLLTFSLYITTFITPVRRLATFAEVFTNGLAGLRRFVDIMRIKPTIEEKPDAVDLKDVKGHIEVKDVYFSYDKYNDALKGVTIDVEPGENVAIVGHSGGGKSTLCQLIPRFYDVNKGAILIDGYDIRDLTKSSLRRNIGIVQQDVFLFADSIYENIRYGKPNATDEEVIAAAKKAEIYDDIMAMPNGFNTYVGERGVLLSGGQKQRISIARIFLKNPSILILDEATSALDSITEALIQESFDKLSQGRTTLTIAHRLATVKNCDRIIVLDGGKIIEEGSHEELINKGGQYASLYKTQNLK